MFIYYRFARMGIRFRKKYQVLESDWHMWFIILVNGLAISYEAFSIAEHLYLVLNQDVFTETRHLEQ